MTNAQSPTRLNWVRVLGPVLWIGAGLVAAYHLALELRAIPLVEPMGKWETIYASELGTWPHEYQWGNYLAGHDIYGPGYPAYCRPFIWILGDPYFACRTANLVALLLACGVFAWVLRRNACAAARTAAWTAVLFAVNAGSYAIQIRPDFLVVLEIVSILAIGQLAAQGRLRAGVFGVILGLLTLAGYFTKPYVVLEPFVVVLFLGLQRRYLYAAVSMTISGAIFFAGLAAYAWANPYYLVETFASNVAQIALDRSWLIHQCGDFFTLVFAAFIGALVAIWAMVRRAAEDGGDVSIQTPGLWLLSAAAGAGALLAGLGWHTGAYLTYYIHLLLVPLCVLAACGRPPASWRNWDLISGLLLLGNLAVLMVLAPGLPKADPGWEALRADILRQPGAVLVDSVMEPICRMRGGVTVADSGLKDLIMNEVSSLKGPAATLARARQECVAFEASQRTLLSQEPPSAIYLDCYIAYAPGAPGGSVPVPRNGLPWFLDEAMKDYHLAETFQIRPFYFSTNSRRQFAGTWQTTILKLVRAGAGPQRP